MARTTHEKELERARANRASEHARRRRAIQSVVALVVVLVVAAVALGAILLNRDGTEASDANDTTAETAAATGAGDDADTDEEAANETAASAQPCPAPGPGMPEPVTTPYAERPTADLGDSEVVRATLTTTCGAVVLELDAAAAPTTVENFVALARDGYYDGVGFHRVVADFMIQGGDPTGTGTGCVDAACEQRLPGYSFDDELGLAEEVVDETGGYPRGTVAMANAGANTNGSQFFIVQADPGYALPPNYAVFGRVVEGLGVVDRIALGPTDGELAVDPVVIVSVDVQG